MAIWAVKANKRSKWPSIYRVTHRIGQVSFLVVFGFGEGKRKRVCFGTEIMPHRLEILITIAILRFQLEQIGCVSPALAR
jgi:hypothetical protein